MTDAPELLPCPFCGSQEARVLPCNSNMVREHRIYPIVRCCGCYLDLPGKNDDFSDDGKTAVSAWNTRATNQQALDAARAEGFRAGLEEAYNALFPIPAASMEQEQMAQRCQYAIRALIDKPADPVAEAARVLMNAPELMEGWSEDGWKDICALAQKEGE